MAGSGNVLKPKKQEPVLEVEETPEEESAPVREKKQKVKKEKPAPVNEPGPIANFIRDERTFKISGMMLIVVSVFLLIGFTPGNAGFCDFLIRFKIKYKQKLLDKIKEGKNYCFRKNWKLGGL
jgi:hypothetical protein